MPTQLTGRILEASPWHEQPVRNGIFLPPVTTHPPSTCLIEFVVFQFLCYGQPSVANPAGPGNKPFTRGIFVESKRQKFLFHWIFPPMDGASQFLSGGTTS
jgi:hypothetical protein